MWPALTGVPPSLCTSAILPTDPCDAALASSSSASATYSLALADSAFRLAEYCLAFAKASLCPHVTDDKIDMMSESLELWPWPVSAMLTIVTFNNVATAAGAESLFSRSMCGIAGVIELEEVPLVFSDRLPEFGAEYPVGSEENKSILQYLV